MPEVLMNPEEWWFNCRQAGGRLHHAATVEFWKSRLLAKPQGPKRMQAMHTSILLVQEGVEKANGVTDSLASYEEASHILTEAWFKAEREEQGEAEARAQHLSEVMTNVLQQVEKPTLGVSTGFPKLDDVLSGGVQRGELCYLGARSGMGKTAFVLQIAAGSAAQGNKVLIASKEMNSIPVGRRMVAQSGRVRAKALKMGSLTQEEASRAVHAAGELSKLPIWILDKFRGLRDIRTAVESLPAHPDLLIVDYLQLLRPPEGIKDRRQQVEAMSKMMKSMADKGRMAVICISSLARKDKNRGKEAPPELSDLRETGELEYDADIVMFLHRLEGESDCQCLIRKNRDGEPGVVELEFTGQYVSFAEKGDDDIGFSFGPRRRDR